MLAIIGGTGLYALDGISHVSEIPSETPFGAPSSAIVKGRLGNHEILFLARHGAGHRQLPHEINYRANIYALKAAGATQIIGISAVGSLRENIAPGELALPTQYFDWTKQRKNSFFGDGVAAHVSTAEPVSKNLSAWISGHAQQLGIALHRNVCYGCVEGPRLGTQAESYFLRNAGCDIVGMTNLPEAFLAREAQICYASIGIVTDYDCWMEDPASHVSVEAIFPLFRESLIRVKALIETMLDGPIPEEDTVIRTALIHSILTDQTSMSHEQRKWLDQLKK